MKYTLLHEDKDQDVIARLLHIRGLGEDLKDFLDPSWEVYRQDPKTLNDIAVASNRIAQAIERNEKIFIFGDYDVDGISSSFILKSFFDIWGYTHVEVLLPHRVQDGYGLKDYLVDRMHDQGAQLIITVDNGITSVAEVVHAKSLGIDMIVTDHHQPLDTLPEPLALINPQVSADMEFRDICGAFVVFKLCLYMCDEFAYISTDHKKTYFTDMLPYVALATVCDCMPLIGENRLIVKKGLALMNGSRSALLPSMRGFLDFLNISQVDSYHMGFMIGPRLNASGRIGSAHDGLDALLCHDISAQKALLENIDGLNTDRKVTQEEMINTASAMADMQHKIIIAAHEDFHEGIVGIVAGRLTNQHHKPSVVIGIDTEKGQASGSLRAPPYFSVINMLKSVDDLLLRFGGHEQAGGLTVELDKIEELKERLIAYCAIHIQDEDIVQHINVDTVLYDHELSMDIHTHISILGPHGEGNREPTFLISDVEITGRRTLGKGDRKHLKLTGSKLGNEISIIFRGKGDELTNYTLGSIYTFIGHIKEDSYRGGWYVHGLYSILEN